jgi:hypothetical protein
METDKNSRWINGNRSNLIKSRWKFCHYTLVYPTKLSHTRHGKHTKNVGKSPCLVGISTISMAIFNRFLYVYQAGYFHGEHDDHPLDPGFSRVLSPKKSNKNPGSRHGQITIVLDLLAESGAVDWLLMTFFSANLLRGPCTNPGRLSNAWKVQLLSSVNSHIPSSKHTKSYWKWPLKKYLPIKNGGSFHSFLYVYQVGYKACSTIHMPGHI